MKDQECTRDPDRQLGLIVQEVQPVFPSLVHGDGRLSLNYDRIGVVAIGAIQEQQQIIDEQRQRIDKLESLLTGETHDPS